MSDKSVKDLRARYNANGNAIIPNTFQHPNIFIDRLMYYLSPVENTVLTFAVRRIIGFQDNIMSRKDNISISQFTDGITTDDGRPLSMGCGIGTDAVIKALDSLALFKILLPTGKHDMRKGQEYWLQENEQAIDWDGLEARKSQKIDKYRRQTKKARYSVQQKGSVEQNASYPVEQNAKGLLNRNTKPTETHRNPHIKEGASAQPKATDFPEVVLFRSVTGRYPSRDMFQNVADAIQKVKTRLNRDVLCDDLTPFWNEWRERDYKRTSLKWLTEWAVSGIITKNGNGKANTNINDVFAEYARENGIQYGN